MPVRQPHRLDLLGAGEAIRHVRHLDQLLRLVQVTGQSPQVDASSFLARLDERRGAAQVAGVGGDTQQTEGECRGAVEANAQQRAVGHQGPDASACSSVPQGAPAMGARPAVDAADRRPLGDLLAEQVGG